MRQRRVWVSFPILLGVCVLGLSACGGPQSSGSGVVNVTVQQCTGRSVTETLYIHQGSSVIATPRVVTGMRYRFSLPAGQYAFSANTPLASLQSVTVNPGGSYRMSFPPFSCN